MHPFQPTSPTRPRTRWPLAVALATVLLSGILSQEATSQVLVYRMSFEEIRGYNVDFFDGGYLVAPALGGAPTLILTRRESGVASYSQGVSGGSFFVGIRKDGKLMATYGSTGSGDAALCAFGPVESTIRLRSTLFDLRIRVAGTLRGGGVASSGEGGEIATDGTVGFAHQADLKMQIDGALTDNANRAGGSVENGVNAVTTYLERNGFRSEQTGTPEDDAGDS